MATAKKHMERSHRSYKKDVDFSAFERKAKIKKAQKKREGILTRLFHRTTKK